METLNLAEITKDFRLLEITLKETSDLTGTNHKFLSQLYKNQETQHIILSSILNCMHTQGQCSLIFTRDSLLNLIKSDCNISATGFDKSKYAAYKGLLRQFFNFDDVLCKRKGKKVTIITLTHKGILTSLGFTEESYVSHYLSCKKYIEQGTNPNFVADNGGMERIIDSKAHNSPLQGFKRPEAMVVALPTISEPIALEIPLEVKIEVKEELKIGEAVTNNISDEVCKLYWTNRGLDLSHNAYYKDVITNWALFLVSKGRDYKSELLEDFDNIGLKSMVERVEYQLTHLN
jgi:hypothetical protein